MECLTSLNRFKQLCESVGVPLKPEKTVLPTTVITFMGLELDSISMEARLPSDKLDKLRVQLATFSHRRKVTLTELQSLVGVLNFCCKVIPSGRSFLRRLIDLTIKVIKPHPHITLNSESRKDITAWKVFIDHFNGKHLLREQRWTNNATLYLFTDASGNIGVGGVLSLIGFMVCGQSICKNIISTLKNCFQSLWR